MESRIDSSEYSHLIVGAGSAGCVLANRLSAQPANRVLLLEAGPSYPAVATPPEVSSPNNYPVVAGSTYVWPMTVELTSDQPNVPYPQGQGVGGSSAINNTWALRPRPGDIRRWETSCAAPITWTDIEANLALVERDLDFGHLPGHGSDGPMIISRLDESQWGPVDRAFRSALSDAGSAWSPDLNAADASGAGPVPMTVDGGRRVSTNDAFLDPVRHRPNLEVRAGTVVRRVVLDNDRAVGVTVVTGAVEQTIRADQVILSAGALRSPGLLLRSGIGPADQLRQAGIEPRVPLDGVGANLVEQPVIAAMLPLVPEHQLTNTQTRQGNCLLRPDGDEHGDEWHLASVNTSPVGPEIGGGFVALMHPDSRGHVTLHPDGNELDVRVGCLNTGSDIERLWTGLERFVELFNHPAVTAIAAGPLLGLDSKPLDIHALAPDRAAWMRRLCLPYHHIAGTCRMGQPNDRLAVVDDDHRVIGTQNLRVIDASTLPDATSSNLNLTVIAVAHHAAAALNANPATGT